MDIVGWLIKSMVALKASGVDSPRRDALVLLEDTLQKDRAWVVTHPEHDLQSQALQVLDGLIARRVKREPLAYIRGKAWFYGRFFEVNPGVMIPRPESESFIEIIKKLNPKTVIDIGTGSGCLAVTAKLEVPNAKVIAIDNSQKALKVAEKNTQKHKVQIEFLHGNLLKPLLSTNYKLQTTVIMANLPYVPEELITSPEITKEPPEALFSGKDGLDHYRQFFSQLAEISSRDKFKYLMAESLETQHQKMISLAKDAGYQLEKTDLLVQLFRKI